MGKVRYHRDLALLYLMFLRYRANVVSYLGYVISANLLG